MPGTARNWRPELRPVAAHVSLTIGVRSVVFSVFCACNSVLESPLQSVTTRVRMGRRKTVESGFSVLAMTGFLVQAGKLDRNLKRTEAEGSEQKRETSSCDEPGFLFGLPFGSAEASGTMMRLEFPIATLRHLRLSAGTRRVLPFARRERRGMILRSNAVRLHARMENKEW